jgi:hypothetical protein
MDNRLNPKRLLVFLVILAASCKKYIIPSPSIASLIVTNVVVNGKTIRVNNNLLPVANNSAAQLTVPPGENNLYVWPVGDSANPYYTSPKFIAEDRCIYSFFLAGQAPNITGILVKDNIPYHTDSTCGVRFINLSPNSTPFNITLSTTPTVYEVSSLGYLQYTDFKLYPAKAANASYTIQVRKASDNSLLYTYPLITPRFTNVTLVIRGLVNASPALTIIRVNNDR